jgi:hypothetical protein
MTLATCNKICRNTADCVFIIWDQTSACKLYPLGITTLVDDDHDCYTKSGYRMPDEGTQKCSHVTEMNSNLDVVLLCVGLTAEATCQ